MVVEVDCGTIMRRYPNVDMVDDWSSDKQIVLKNGLGETIAKIDRADISSMVVDGVVVGGGEVED